LSISFFGVPRMLEVMTVTVCPPSESVRARRNDALAVPLTCGGKKVLTIQMFIACRPSIWSGDQGRMLGRFTAAAFLALLPDSFGIEPLVAVILRYKLFRA